LESLDGRDHSEDLAQMGDNIKMDLKEIVWEGADWIDVFFRVGTVRWLL
jgi:hypothetical protein